MNLSSILVVTAASKVHNTIETLSKFDDLEVHFCDESSGRIIVTQETEDTDMQIAGLQRIKSLPNVVLAEMVYHYCGGDNSV